MGLGFTVALGGDEGSIPSCSEHDLHAVNGVSVLLPLIATRDYAKITRGLWANWKPLDTREKVVNSGYLGMKEYVGGN